MTRRAAALAFALLAACGGETSGLDAAAHLDAAPAPDAAPADAGFADAEPPDAGFADAEALDTGPSNRPPVVEAFEASPSAGLAPLPVAFTWSVSDPDGDPLTCTFDRDGVNGEAPRSVDCATSTTVTYHAEGLTQAILQVADEAGATDEALAEVEVERPFRLPDYLQGGYAQAGSPLPDLDVVEASCVETLTAAPDADITAPLRQAVSAAGGRVPSAGHCVVSLPAGTFSVTGPVTLPSGVVLRGAGAQQTRLRARMPGAQAVVAARGRAAALSYEGELVGGDKGTHRLVVTATIAARVAGWLGDGHRVYGEISIDNDPLKFPSEWERGYAAFGIGQVFGVIGVEMSELVLDRPLNEPYMRPGLVRRFELRTEAEMTERVGLADLAIERLDANHAGTVAFNRTAQAFLQRVRVEKTGWAHVHVDRSVGCTVVQSHFEDAHDFGGGGQGYGINLRHHTTGCRLEDNTFRRLRHALILQLGSNGNVVGYNYAEDSRDNLGWLKADVSLHGHYTHMNLIEGNVVEKIHVSDWWGPSPFHVVFRNRASRGGIYIDDNSEDCAVIDNHSEGPFPLEAALRVDRSVTNVLCVNNADFDGVPLTSSHRDCDDENDPAIVSERPRPASFYRDGPLVTADGRLPAQVRFESGQPVPSRP